jgi:hypothetical protein
VGEPTRQPVRRLAALTLALLLAAATAVSCSESRDLGATGRTKTTIRRVDDPDADEDALAGGSAGAREMQKIIDRLVASNDPCAILTQKDVKGYQIDATTLASTATRKVLATGVIDVYDHLVDIIGDPSVRPALEKQRDTFVQVLEIVNRYTANPTSKQGDDQIRALTTGPEFVAAQNAVATWTINNCS